MTYSNNTNKPFIMHLSRAEFKRKISHSLDALQTDVHEALYLSNQKDSPVECVILNIETYETLKKKLHFFEEKFPDLEIKITSKGREIMHVQEKEN
ncbi:hypothetical protein JHD48_07780 [Sulfurimonas sp. SAG-AH-194-I05]|nr:hypothetical protein [Sulfurimonas sp. SAG-AH-194-I05]MDF1875630.1 hypothetical protein [Sulfurimonas sp. SAG-AH-194-I05]